MSEEGQSIIEKIRRALLKEVKEEPGNIILKKRIAAANIIRDIEQKSNEIIPELRGIVDQKEAEFKLLKPELSLIENERRQAENNIMFERHKYDLLITEQEKALYDYDSEISESKILEKIKALEKECEACIAKLQKIADSKKAKLKSFQADLSSAEKEYWQARQEASIQSVEFDTRMNTQMNILYESYSQDIDTALSWFRDKLDYLRKSGRIIFSQDKKYNPILDRNVIKISSNRPALMETIQYCNDCLHLLEDMKLAPKIDIAMIEDLKSNIPDFNIVTEVNDEQNELALKEG